VDETVKRRCSKCGLDLDPGAFLRKGSTLDHMCRKCRYGGETHRDRPPTRVYARGKRGRFAAPPPKTIESPIVVEAPITLVVEERLDMIKRIHAERRAAGLAPSLRSEELDRLFGGQLGE
jgi:hypothetical protein